MNYETEYTESEEMLQLSPPLYPHLLLEKLKSTTLVTFLGPEWSGVSVSPMLVTNVVLFNGQGKPVFLS